MCKEQSVYNAWWYLIQSLEVPTASVSWRANVLHRRAEVREVVGQTEGGWQESGDKHLTDLEKHQQSNDLTTQWEMFINCYQLVRTSVYQMESPD